MTDVLESLRAAAVVAVLRAPDAEGALRAVDALVAGGVTGIEVTYSTPDAPEVIETLAQRYGEQIVLGAGTVRTPAEATTPWPRAPATWSAPAPLARRCSGRPCCSAAHPDRSCGLGWARHGRSETRW